MVNSKFIKQWLVEQDYYSYEPDAETIKVRLDPKVPGTFAVQFQDTTEDRVVQLLFVTGNESGTDKEILENTLEEVELDSWPPKSGDLQFF